MDNAENSVCWGQESQIKGSSQLQFLWGRWYMAPDKEESDFLIFQVLTKQVGYGISSIL